MPRWDDVPILIGLPPVHFSPVADAAPSTGCKPERDFIWVSC